MKLLLLSEGPLDYGDRDEFLADGSAGRPGALRPLIKQCLEDWVQIESRPLSRGRGHGKAFGRPLPGPHLSAKARVLRRNLRSGDHEGVVVVEDGDGKRVEKLTALREGRSAAGAVGDRAPCAIGVPKRMVESWLLGDAGACERLCGNIPDGWPTTPEREAGARGTSTYPKRRLRSLLLAAGCTETDFVTVYGELATRIRVDELRRSCPESFAPFADELEAELGPLLGRPAKR